MGETEDWRRIEVSIYAPGNEILGRPDILPRRFQPTCRDSRYPGFQFQKVPTQGIVEYG